MHDMLAHTIQGDGPVVVLIHGFCENKSLWTEYATSLSKHYTIICLDLPGFGESAPEFAEAVTMEYYAKRVHELLDHVLERERQVTMIGHSLGGYVTLAYAELYGEQLNGIGLFHSSAFADDEEKKLSRVKVAEYIQEKGVAPFTDNFVEPLFYVANRNRLATEINALKEQARQSSKEGAVAATYAMKERVERISLLSTLAYPVLFILGKNDTVVTLEKGLEQCQLPMQSLVFIVDKVLHMGMLEEKEKCLSILNNFISLCEIKNKGY